MAQCRRVLAPLNSGVAKDLALAGVKSVSIYDPEPATIQDLSTQVRYIFAARYIAEANAIFLVLLP